jgi:hypothetical protein
MMHGWHLHFAVDLCNALLELLSVGFQHLRDLPVNFGDGFLQRDAPR